MRAPLTPSSNVWIWAQLRERDRLRALVPLRLLRFAVVLRERRLAAGRAAAFRAAVVERVPLRFAPARVPDRLADDRVPERVDALVDFRVRLRPLLLLELRAPPVPVDRLPLPPAPLRLLVLRLRAVLRFVPDLRLWLRPDP